MVTCADGRANEYADHRPHQLGADVKARTNADWGMDAYGVAIEHDLTHEREGVCFALFF